jgi:hypothetical protein
VDKPAGRYCEAVAAAASAACAAAAEQPGAEPAAPLVLVHRLDRDTSGVLLLARQRCVLPALTRAFSHASANEHDDDAHAAHAASARKLYLALSASPLPPDWPACELGGDGSLRSRSVRSGHGRSAGGLWRAYPAAAIGAALPCGGGAVRAAATLLTALHADASSLPLARPLLLLAQPAQGRTHQIRIHAQLAGVPLAGDARYGGALTWHGSDAADADAHCLHAALLALPHPITGRPLAIAAPLPRWAAAAAPAAAAQAQAAVDDALATWSAAAPEARKDS